MNHAEHAEKLLQRYHDGQGSDQAAIAHAVLALNDTLRNCFGGRVVGTSDSRDNVVLVLKLQTELAAVNKRIAKSTEAAQRLLHCMEQGAPRIPEMSSIIEDHIQKLREDVLGL